MMREKRIQDWRGVAGLVLIFAVLILGATHKLGIW